jgi:hypothetical protein
MDLQPGVCALILLELLLIAFGLLALVWVLFSAVRAVIGGRGSPGTVITLMALGLIFLALLGQNNWLVGLDAFGCSDGAEVFMDPVQGRVKGTIRGWDFMNCSIYWRDRPRVWG